MAETVFWVGAILLMLSGLIFFDLVKKDEKEKLIQRAIELAGGSVVGISKGQGGDRSTFGFDVRFQDQEGRIYATCCTVKMFSNQLYWTQNPSYLLEHSLGYIDTRSGSGEQSFSFSDSEFNLDDDGTKELVINSLTSPYRYERQAMIKRLAESEVIDEVILQLLQEIVESDEDEEVRETAVATLKNLNTKV